MDRDRGLLRHGPDGAVGDREPALADAVDLRRLYARLGEGRQARFEGQEGVQDLPIEAPEDEP